MILVCLTVLRIVDVTCLCAVTRGMRGVTGKDATVSTLPVALQPGWCWVLRGGQLHVDIHTSTQQSLEPFVP